MQNTLVLIRDLRAGKDLDGRHQIWYSALYNGHFLFTSVNSSRILTCTATLVKPVPYINGTQTWSRLHLKKEVAKWAGGVLSTKLDLLDTYNHTYDYARWHFQNDRRDLAEYHGISSIPRDFINGKRPRWPRSRDMESVRYGNTITT